MKPHRGYMKEFWFGFNSLGEIAGSRIKNLETLRNMRSTIARPQTYNTGPQYVTLVI